jgi:hypothetical protein
LRTNVASRLGDETKPGQIMSVMYGQRDLKEARWARFKDPVDQNLPPPLLFFLIEKPKSDTISTANTAPHI